MAIDKNRLRDAARGTDAASGSDGGVDINALRDSAQQRTSSSGSTGSNSGGSSSNSGTSSQSGSWFWIILIVGAVWFFFGRGKKEEAAPAPAPVAQSIKAPPPQATLQKTTTLDINELMRSVASTNQSGIESVLSIAEGTAEKSQIESAAREVGRSYGFTGLNIIRDRKRARSLHDPIRETLNQPGDLRNVCRQMGDAFQADPLDAEIAGNLAICILRLERISDARIIAMYALSLPRSPEKTGRTSDWATLAAAYAAAGDHQKAKQALFVTLAIAPDPAKRCYSAVYSVKNTYGPALRAATERMFERVRDQGISSAMECALPIEW
jgi:hypothetical protein